jgi:hypothetical protein
MTEDSAAILAQIKAHTQSLFDRLDAKIDARFSQLQRSIDAIAIEQQLTHGIVVRLQVQELLKAKVITADAEASREDRAERDTMPPNGRDEP